MIQSHYHFLDILLFGCYILNTVIYGIYIISVRAIEDHEELFPYFFSIYLLFSGWGQIKSAFKKPKNMVLPIFVKTVLCGECERPVQ